MLISKKLRGVQLGLESLSQQGTLVAANRLIKNITFSNKRMNNVKKAEAEGHKSAIGQQRGHRWSEWKASGQFGYSIAPYIGAMLINGASGQNPTVVGTGAYQYQFNMSSQNSDTPQTVTFDYGNNQGENSRLGFGTLSDFTLKINEGACDYDLSGFAAYPSKNITMTANPVLIPTYLASETDFKLLYSPSLTNLSTSKLLTARDIEISVKSKYKSTFFIDDATISIGGILEKKPDIMAKIVVAEGTESDNFLSQLESSTLGYFQLQATGPLIVAGTPNVYQSFKLYSSMYANNEDEMDDADLFAGSYDFYSGEDVIQNNELTMTCVTPLASL